MGKYYDKLIQMNENLDKELMEKGVVNIGLTTNDKLVKDDKTDIMKEDGENTIEISTDSLTDDQKKKILLDKGVDQKTLDNLKDPKELDGALSATLNNDEVKQESADDEDDISEEVVIRMDDDDLDMHGYVSTKGGKELMLTDKIEEAQVFQHEELGQNRIEAICYKFHYDPNTFKTVSIDPRADEPYEDSDYDNFGENWVSLDPMHPDATTLP
jgi:MoaA/NifB/PqqE/SkfB family radical SAM enzyme